MSDPPSEVENDQEESEEEQPNSRRIVIIDERTIPFVEERPPNFSPHYAVKVHRVKKAKHVEEDEE
jgi:hypothetical protein